MPSRCVIWMPFKVTPVMFFSSKRLHVEGKTLRHFNLGTKYDIDSKRLLSKPFGSLIAIS